MNHADFFALLETLTPTRLAEPWDNVGLLLDPEPARSQVARVLVAIDLTEPVLAEALAFDADVVVAYHPAIFSGLKRITRETPMGRRLLRLAQAGVALWSPHTALDAIPGGMNDWLATGLGDAATSAALKPCAAAPELAGAGLQGAGLGRLITLTQPVTLAAAVARLKTHLGLSHVRVAAAPAHVDRPDAPALPIDRIALCPGAGGSLFAPLPGPTAGGPALYVTGEWGHHDVLAKVAQGASVVLTEHSNTERGFLPIYATWLRQGTTNVDVRVSRRDADPLVVW